MSTESEPTTARPWHLWILGAAAAMALVMLFWSRGGRNSKMILVYVIGEVHTPGVVSVPEDARVVHAIEKAGGLTTRADPEAINLAARLSDEEKIIIPARAGLPPAPSPPVQSVAPQGGPVAAIRQPPPPPPVAAGGAEEGSGHWEGGVVVEGDSEPDLMSEPSGGSHVRVSVNRATVEELETVPGLGPDLAQKIVAFRQGPPARGFSTLEDLTQVPGIKTAKLEQLRPYIDL